MRAFRLFLFCGMLGLLASCQTSRATFSARAAGPAGPFFPDSVQTVLLLHDSQGPQATRAVMTAAEAASFHQR